MKFLFVLVVPAWALSALSFARFRTSETSPVTQIVRVLEELESGVKRQSEEEEKLCAKGACWAKKETEAIHAGRNSSAKRVQELEEHIRSLDADLVKESHELQLLSHGTQSLAIPELEKMVSSLSKVSTVLDDIAWKRKAEADPMPWDERFSSVSDRDLRRVLQIGHQSLTVGDVLFIKSLFRTGESVTSESHADDKARRRLDRVASSLRALRDGVSHTLQVKMVARGRVMAVDAMDTLSEAQARKELQELLEQD